MPGSKVHAQVGGQFSMCKHARMHTFTSRQAYMWVQEGKVQRKGGVQRHCARSTHSRSALMAVGLAQHPTPGPTYTQCIAQEHPSLAGVWLRSAAASTQVKAARLKQRHANLLINTARYVLGTWAGMQHK